MTLSLALGIIGTVLGIWNAFYALRKDRVRLRVIPQFMPVFGQPDERGVSHTEQLQVSIRVVNVGRIPVTISSAGYLMSPKYVHVTKQPPFWLRWRKPGPAKMIPGIRSLPRKLEPLSAIDLDGPEMGLHVSPDERRIRDEVVGVFVETARMREFKERLPKSRLQVVLPGPERMEEMSRRLQSKVPTVDNSATPPAHN